jgi:hypothetical protein
MLDPSSAWGECSYCRRGKRFAQFHRVRNLLSRTASVATSDCASDYGSLKLLPPGRRGLIAVDGRPLEEVGVFIGYLALTRTKIPDSGQPLWHE